MKLRNQQVLAMLLAGAMSISSVTTGVTVFAEEAEKPGAEMSAEAADEDDTETVLLEDEDDETELLPADVSIEEDSDQDIVEQEVFDEAEAVIIEEADVVESIDTLFNDPSALDEVKAMIASLDLDPTTYKPEDRDRIEEIITAYEALSAEEQEIIDTEALDGGQPYGRVLESAWWGILSLEEVDNSTTLPDGTYDATTTPALSSSYSKGKSTSSRQKPWSVKSVTVADGKATAVITVESTSYSKIWTQGRYFDKTNTSGNSEFADVPIDLNNTFYLAGVSTSMPRPIAFSVTNEIEETEEPEKENLSITNETNMFKAIDAFLYTAEGVTNLVVTLNGTGYHELFKGTYDEAVATGEDSSRWIIGKLNEVQDGKYTFTIPLTDEELAGKALQVQALSFSHKEAGDGLWWYPRMMVIDREAKTLVTDDYHETIELALTNNAGMFKVNGADLEVIGGPPFQ